MQPSGKIKVVILGGGVAGLSAAHHLLTKGKDRFEVVIIERREPGGKARSQKENGLPNEHGFRFFPGFYKHITETMKEIPLAGGGNVYKNNLVNTEYYTFLFTGKPGRLDVPIHIGGSIKKLHFRKLIRQLKQLREQISHSGVKVEKAGQEKFAEKMLEVYTTCNERIESTYDNISWTDFIDARGTAEKYGADYETLLATGISKNLVAVRADVANSRTGAKLVGHMIWHILNPSAPPADKLLNAPTKDAWLDPWINFLKSKGLKILADRRVVKFEFDPKEKKVTGIKHDNVENLKYQKWNFYDDPENTKSLPVEGDAGTHFICAMPIEKTKEILNRSWIIDPATQDKIYMSKTDPALGNYKKLYRYTEWMNGIMYYFDEDIDITNGHITVADEDAAVTMISQLQYWEEYLKDNPVIYKNPDTGEESGIKTVLSVIVSNWNAKSKYIEKKGVRLKDLDKEEVVEEIKEIVFRCEDASGQKLDRFRKNLKHHFLDNSIMRYDETKTDPSNLPNPDDRPFLYNKEPLFINKIYTYHLRPEACTQFSNFCMASDYLKTNADLGCMDSADEAARRAVNNILESNNLKPVCSVNGYAMPSFFGFFSTARMIDYRRFKKGLPYSKKTIIHKVIKWFLLAGVWIVRKRMPLPIKALLFVLLGVFFFLAAFINLLFKPFLAFTHVRPF